MAQDARLAKREQHTAAQIAWLTDIAKPFGAKQTQKATVMEHVKNTRRLEESARVFDTMSAAAFTDFPLKLSAVTRGGRLEGLMQSTEFDQLRGRPVASPNLAIGFLSTHPRNISGPEKTAGVGSAMIDHAKVMARGAGSTNITLGAEGQEAQGFYQHQGFEHQDGRRLSAADFTHGTLPLKLPIR